MLSFFPRGVLDEILNLIESVSEGFPSYSWYYVLPNVWKTGSVDSNTLLSMPMGVDYIVIGFDMEVQPLVTHNAA